MQFDEWGTTAALPLQEQVYTLIKEEIVGCEMPPGAVINEDILVEKFKTSRTPIREALLRLKGTFVSQISLQDIYEIYQLRLIIEPQTIRIACRNLDAKMLGAYRDFFIGLETGDCSNAEWFRQDREMHCYIVNASGNGHLRDIFATIMDQNMRMRMMAGKVLSRMRSTNHEHLGILDALIAGNEDRAVELMTAHITASRDAALKLESLL